MPQDVLYSSPLAALESLSHYTPARQGDRTIVDALYPFCTSLAACTTDNKGQKFGEAVGEARKGAERTKGMKARLGRATYVGVRDEEALPPDPGAWGVAVLLEGFAKGLNEEVK